MNDWDKILDDFARKCKGGAPDMTNPRHLALLRESLIKFGWKEFATNEFIGNLRNGKEVIVEKREPNSIWKTSSGWAGWKTGQDKPRYGMGSEESANAYISGQQLEKVESEKKVSKEEIQTLNSDEILVKVSGDKAPNVIPVSIPSEVNKRTAAHRKAVFEGKKVGKGGTDTTAQEEMANIGREIAAKDPNLTQEELIEAIKKEVKNLNDKYPDKKLNRLVKKSASGLQSMDNLTSKEPTNYDYNKNQPDGYPTSTTDTYIVRDTLITKLKEVEGRRDKACEVAESDDCKNAKRDVKHYKNELYWYQRKATGKDVTGKEGDADTMMIYEDSHGNTRITYITNKQTEADMIANSTIETTKKSILEHMDDRLGSRGQKKVLGIAVTQSKRAKKFNTDYASNLNTFSKKKKNMSSLKSISGTLNKAATVDKGQKGRSIFVDPKKIDKKRQRKYVEESKQAPEVRAKLLEMDPPPDPEKNKEAYSVWKKEVKTKWESAVQSGTTFKDEDVIQASISASGTGNLVSVGSGASGAPYTIIKMTDTTSDVRSQVNTQLRDIRRKRNGEEFEKKNPRPGRGKEFAEEREKWKKDYLEAQRAEDGMSGEDHLKSHPDDKQTAIDNVVSLKDKDGKSYMGGQFDSDDITNIYDNKELEELEKIATKRGEQLEGMYTETTEQLRELDEEWKKKQEWYNDKNADGHNQNGPHERSYVSGFFERVHFSDYVSGEVDGRVMAEMGPNSHEPKDIRDCLSTLTEFKGDPKDLMEHLLNNVKPKQDDQLLVYVNKNNEEIVLGKDDHRTAGRSEKMAGAYGLQLVNCLKEKGKS